ncbi:MULTISPECIES: hypothetical protein [Streptomyces]|uniref:hypothetical protein n=1 Tax=Streptomyces TaxID=1883 RepID=UPI0016766688|nr:MULTISPECIES: hypothetical protein [Streptomyces]MBD3580721.1 hypothetical protein [Streptomyces sp. KD18]GGT29911.1 hypothetical protein GCM10010286_63910 [Streptomyces toxytricini]
MNRSDRRRHGAAALTACFGALAYTVSKVHLAWERELGMPGFPAPAESYAAISDVRAAQWGNAALGLLMAILALLLARPPRRRALRLAVLAASWAGTAVVGAGVAGFAARATGLAPALGAVPPRAAPAAAALLVGALWVGAWAAATVSAARIRRPAERVDGPAAP